MTDGMMTNIRKVTVNVCRILLAGTFIFSGLVKAVDPLGTQYKIHDYAVAMGIEQFIPDYLTLSAAVLLSALEFTELRTLAGESSGKGPGPESSLLKIKGTEIQQRVTASRTTRDVVRDGKKVTKPGDAIKAGDWPKIEELAREAAALPRG